MFCGGCGATVTLARVANLWAHPVRMPRGSDAYLVRETREELDLMFDGVGRTLPSSPMQLHCFHGHEPTRSQI